MMFPSRESRSVDYRVGSNLIENRNESLRAAIDLMKPHSLSPRLDEVALPPRQPMSLKSSRDELSC